METRFYSEIGSTKWQYTMETKFLPNETLT